METILNKHVYNKAKFLQKQTLIGGCPLPAGYPKLHKEIIFA